MWARGRERTGTRSFLEDYQESGENVIRSVLLTLFIIAAVVRR